MSLFAEKRPSKFIVSVLAGVAIIGLQACSLQKDQTRESRQGQPGEVRVIKGPATKINKDYQQNAELVYLLLLAEVSAQKGELAISVASYLKASQISSDPKIAERATRVASFARDYPSAMLAAERWAELRPRLLDAQHSLVILYLRNNMLDKAAGAVEKVLKLTEKSKIQGYGHLIALLNNEKDKKSVMLLMEKVVAKHSENTYANFAYARLALQFKQYEKAKVFASKSIKLKPDFEAAHSLIARIYMVLGETDKAMATMQALLKKSPKSVAHRATYARLLAVAKRYDQALKQFGLVLKQSPDNPDIVYAVALLTLEQRKLKLSEKYFNKLLSMHKRVLESYYYLGSIAEKRKQYNKAIGWYIKVKHGDNKFNANIRVAQLLAKQGKMKSARDYLHSLGRNDPNLAVRLIIIEIDILSNAKDYKTAMQVADQGLKEFSGNADLLYARSMLAEKADRMDIAEADLRTILKTEPDNVNALNALGYTLADKTTRFKEAHGYIERALKLSPKEPAILDSMGWVLYRMGRMDDAISYLRKALEFLPDDEIAAHLGEVLWVSGNKQEASKVWAKALKDTPDSEHLKEVLKRFKK